MSCCIVLNRCILVNRSQVEVKNEKLMMLLAPDMAFDLTIYDMHQYHKYKIYNGVTAAQFKNILQDNHDAMYENFELRDNCLIIENSVEVIESEIGSNLISDTEVSDIEFKLTVFALLRFLITHDCSFVITRGFFNKIKSSVEFHKSNLQKPANAVSVNSNNSVSDIEYDVSSMSELTGLTEPDNSSIIEDTLASRELSEADILNSILVSNVSADEQYDTFEDMMKSLKDSGRVVENREHQVIEPQVNDSSEFSEDVISDFSDATELCDVPCCNVRCSLISDTIYLDAQINSEIYRLPIWSVSNKMYQNYWSVRASTSTIQVLKNLYSTCVMSVSGNLVQLSPFGVTPIGLTVEDFYTINSSALIASQLGYREMISTACSAADFAEFIAQQLAGIISVDSCVNLYPDVGTSRYLITGNTVDVLYMKSLLFGKTRGYILSNILASFKGKMKLSDAMQKCFTFKGIYGKIFLDVFCNALRSAKVIYNKQYFENLKSKLGLLLAVQDMYMLELRTLQLEYRGVLEPLRRGVRSGDITIRVLE